MSEKIKAHIALSFVALFYGLNYVIAKDVLVKEFMTPFGFIMLRVSFVGIIILCIHSIFIREKMDRKDIGYVALCSVFGATLNMLCFFEGLKYTSSIHASLIMVLTPALVLIISAVIIKEKVTKTKIFGITLGLIGAALLVSNGGANDKEASVYGDFMIMINAISYGIYLVLIRRLTKKYNPITVLKWIFIFGILFNIPFGGKQMISADWSNFPASIWWAIAYVILLATAGTYLLNVYALSKVMPSTVGFYLYFQPLIATTAAIVLGTDSLNIIKVCSAILLFAGVYLINKKMKVVQSIKT